jgi:hypothetical protein
MIMIKSILPWLNVSASYRPFISYDGVGNKSYGDVTSFLCYPEGSVEIVKDAVGNEVMSKLKLYVKGTNVINENDEVTFNSEVYEVKAVAPYYRDGVADIKVVYI